VQKIFRKLVYLVIGPQDLDSSFDTLPRHDAGFKEQRARREVAGLCGLYFLQLPVAAFDPSPVYLFGLESSIWFWSLIGVELVLFVVAVFIRRDIES